MGKSVFQEVFLKNPGGLKTRILVTHAIHFLPKVDYIYTMVDGRIAETGTYAELMENGQEFSKFVTEFGSKNEEHEEETLAVAEVEDGEVKPAAAAKTGKGDDIMQVEERNTGGVDGGVYSAYIRAAKGSVLIPMLVVGLVLIQGCTVMSSYWLVPPTTDMLHDADFYLGLFTGRRSVSKFT